MESTKFETEYRDIEAAAGQITEEINALAAKVEAAGVAKEEAKDQYGKSLDAGDEKAMKAALGKIRDANADREAAVSLLRSPDIPARIQALQQRQEALGPEIASMRKSALVALESAQANVRAVEVLRGRRQGLFSVVCGVEESLNRAIDALGPNLQDGRVGIKGASIHS